MINLIDYWCCSNADVAVQFAHTEVGSGTRETEPKVHKADDEGCDLYAHLACIDFDLFFFLPSSTNLRKGMSIYYTKDSIKRKWLTYCKKENTVLHSMFGICKVICK